MAENLGNYVRYWSRRFPNRPAVRFEGSTITWRELDDNSDRFAAGLIEAGIARGDVVGVLLRNQPLFLAFALGAFKVGAVLALLNPRLTPFEMAHPLRDTGARLVVTQPDLADLLSDGAAENPSLTVYTTGPVDGCLPVDKLMPEGGRPPIVPVDADEVALISYTSGTTGFPKGALLTHGSLRATASARPVAAGITWKDNLLIPIPLAFAGGMCYFIRESLLIGATTILAPDSDPERVLSLIESERVANWGSVAAIFQMVMDHERFERTDLSSLTHVQAGGGPIHLEMLSRWAQRGIHVAQGYGLTEASGECVTLLFADEAAEHNGSAGLPLINRRVRIVGADGTVLGPHEEGRICISGPSLMKGYLNQDEATSRVLKDGWLDTGDLGSVDENGYLFVLGRRDDMFVSGGLNVYPAEIELALTGCLPGLEELAVIGVSDEKWGQVPLLVLPDVEQVDLENLQQIYETRLADYKRPRRLASYGGPLPRNMNGKLMKMPLRERYQALPGESFVQMPRTRKEP